MASVFIVRHSYEVGDRDEVKLIGVYGSRSDAEAAIVRLASRLGFRDHPSGFRLDEYQIGKDHWVEGFSSLVTVMVPVLDEGVDVWRPVHAETLSHGRYRIVTENADPDDERWAFNTGEVVRCEERECESGSALVAVALADDAAHTLKEDRLISTDEAAIVTWMLLHASVAGSLSHLASSVASLRVVGRCSCGCGSVDFEMNGQASPFQPIADGTGENREGLEIGVVLWGRQDLITGLEFYDKAGAATSLPLISTLRTW